jgi:hypothetical protein
MKVLDKHIKQYQIFATTIVSALTTFILSVIEDRFKDKTVSNVVTTVVVVILSYLLGKIFESIIENNRSIRKFLLGDDFIEGYWYDEAKDLSHVTLYSIKFKNDNYVVEGESFNEMGKSFSTWKSEVSIYDSDGRILYINYRLYTDNPSKPLEFGILNLNFAGSPTTSNTGFYCDHTSNIKSTIQGVKLTDEEIEIFGNFIDRKEKGRFVIEKLKQNQIVNNS